MSAAGSRGIWPAMLCALCLRSVLAADAVEPAQTPPAQQPAANALTLAQAHQMALENHPALSAARYRSLAADQAVIEARSGLFPQVNLVGDAVDAGAANTRILAGGLNNPSVLNRVAGGVLMSQLLTDFGHTTNLTASSKFAAAAASQDLSATREQVLLRVDEAYFGALQAQAVLQVANETFTTRQLLLDQVSLLAQNKLKSELDVSFARVGLEEGRLLVQRAQSGLDNAAAVLSSALGLHRVTIFRLEEQREPEAGGAGDIAALTERALAERPDLASLRDERDSADRLARAQRDARLPTVAAIGAAGGSLSHDPRLPGDYLAGGIQVSVPLFAGGLYRAREREAELRARSVGELLRSAEDDVARDVRIAWANLTTARERLRTTQQLVAQANQAFDLAQARYRVGSSSIVELSQAQLAATSAQIENANARYDVLIQQSLLRYELGGLMASAASTEAAP